MRKLSDYQREVDRALSSLQYPPIAPRLYQPIEYGLQTGGKRIRPVLLLAVYDWLANSTAALSEAMPAALAVEIFHNFTLLHDDIMDHSTLRRGVPTVWAKWSKSVAILSGDAMNVLAYQHLNQINPKYLQPLQQTFNWLALAVCQGQQLDMEFELRETVQLEEYMEMIYLKTSALIEGALKMGAQLSDAPEVLIAAISDFGKELGLAFQLQDDYLDAFGDTSVFGKECGNDIFENKCTYLSIWTYDHADEKQRAELRTCAETHAMPRDEKVKRVLDVYTAVGVKKATEEAITDHLSAAQSAIDHAADCAGSRPITLDNMLKSLTGREK